MVKLGLNKHFPNAFCVLKNKCSAAFDVLFFFLSSSPLISSAPFWYPPKINWKETIQSRARGKPLILLNTCPHRDCFRRWSIIIAYPTFSWCFLTDHEKKKIERIQLFQVFNSRTRKPWKHTWCSFTLTKQIIFTYSLCNTFSSLINFYFQDKNNLTRDGVTFKVVDMSSNQTDKSVCFIKKTI